MVAIVVIIIAAVIFAAGITVGTIAVVTWGIHQEERDFTLTRRAPNRVSQGARILTGLYVRQRTDQEPSQSHRPDIYA
ncbi:MAG TPA: hypothetical protein VGH77_00350 [Streptosporangiaceae bacterium]|jgi:hypothetical protein